MRGLAGRALVETMMIGRRAGTSRRRGTPSTRRKTFYKETGLHTGRDGGGAPAWDSGLQESAKIKAKVKNLSLMSRRPPRGLWP